MAESKWDGVGGPDKTLVMIIRTVAVTAIVIVLSCLIYHHVKTEKVQIEELRNTRMELIFENIRYKDEHKLKIYLTYIRDIANAAGTDLTENEVKEIQGAITKELDLETAR